MIANGARSGCQGDWECFYLEDKPSSQPRGFDTSQLSGSRGTCRQLLQVMLRVGPDLRAIPLAPLRDEEEAHDRPTLKAELLSRLSPIGLGVTCSSRGFGEVIA